MRSLSSLLIAVTLLAAADTPFPGTKAGVVLKAWLAAFNSGDRAQIGSFLAQFDPDHKDDVDRLLGLREQSGGFNLIRIETSESLHVVATVKERDGDAFARLMLTVSDSPAPTVKQFGLNRIPRPLDQPEQPRLTFDSAVQALDRQANQAASQDRFSGSVLIARGGTIRFQKAYGLADREKHQANTIDSKFRIGSMNKMFTATAILQLVGAGKIDLEAPLGTYLTNYPNPDVAAKVKIRHLLTHTGGTGDIFTPEYEKHRLETRELNDYIKLFGSRGLEFEPGSEWSYSNYGFVLLGAVIEKVAGISYYDYVDKNIFETAGMHQTGSLPENAHVPERSTGYMNHDGKWLTNTDTLPWRATSAGGGYSTAGDLFRFAQALSNGKLIPPALLARMTSKQAGGDRMPPDEGYGFGMQVSSESQGKRFGHGGGAPGMNGELRVYPKTATVVVVLANLDPPAATRLADFFDARMPTD